MNCILLSEVVDEKSFLLKKNQINHVIKVLKASVGDSLKVGLLDGLIGSATITKIGNEKIELSNVILNRKPPEKLDLIVILALPRPKVLRRLIMDMTAQGVKKIILVNSYKTEKSYWQSPMLQRLDEFVEEGLQQAVDTVVPIIELQKRFKPFVEDDFPKLINSHLSDNSLTSSPINQAVVAHPYVTQSWKDYKSNNTLPQILCIGAEGGWIDYEIELFKQQGCKDVSLGRRILRTETAVNTLIGSWL